MDEDSTMIKIENASKHYGGTVALDDVSFTIKKGEVHALVGENGAGKSTLMKILAGVEIKDSGKIYIKEKEMTANNPIEARAAGISIVFQELNLFPAMTVFENIFITREKKIAGITNKSKMARDSVKILHNIESDHEISPFAKSGGPGSCRPAGCGNMQGPILRRRNIDIGRTEFCPFRG